VLCAAPEREEEDEETSRAGGQRGTCALVFPCLLAGPRRGRHGGTGWRVCWPVGRDEADGRVPHRGENGRRKRKLLLHRALLGHKQAKGETGEVGEPELILISFFFPDLYKRYSVIQMVF